MGYRTSYTPKKGGAQTITTSGTSAKVTNPAPVGVREAYLYATQDAYIAVGPTGAAATSSDMFLPASSPHYIAVPHGDYVHALQVSSSGTVYVCWMV